MSVCVRACVCVSACMRVCSCLGAYVCDMLRTIHSLYNVIILHTHLKVHPQFDFFTRLTSNSKVPNLSTTTW